jgi:hypothetical protein
MLLSSADSTSLTDLKSLSDLARSFEETMEVAFSNFGVDFKADKLVLARNAAHLMREYPNIISSGQTANFQNEYQKSDKSSLPFR